MTIIHCDPELFSAFLVFAPVTNLSLLQAFLSMGHCFISLVNMPLSLRTKNLSDHCLADSKRPIVGQR